MAGGLTVDADISTVNLSQKVHDQMLILIPKGRKSSAKF